MEKMAEVEDVVTNYYERIWPRFVLWWAAEKTLGLHYALYEKGVNTFEQAVLNMSNYVGKLLSLDASKKMKILDAGCGVGGTSIYLAKKYPNSNFIGITITPGQIALANKFAEERHVENADFMLGNYMKTDFSNQSFDNIFALESASYSRNKEGFVKEMHRILKPGGRIAVIDTFLMYAPHDMFMKKLHDLICIGRGVPVDEDLILKDFLSHLKKHGFTDIKVKNLSRNVARSQLRSFIIGIPFFFYSIIKYIVTLGRCDHSKDTNYYLGTSVLCAFYGLTGAGKYYSITAVKS